MRDMAVRAGVWAHDEGALSEMPLALAPLLGGPDCVLRHKGWAQGQGPTWGWEPKGREGQQ